jgi:hypothetical protein
MQSSCYSSAVSCCSWQQQVSPPNRVRWLKEQGLYRFSGSFGADVSESLKRPRVYSWLGTQLLLLLLMLLLAQSDTVQWTNMQDSSHVNSHSSHSCSVLVQAASTGARQEAARAMARGKHLLRLVCVGMTRPPSSSVCHAYMLCCCLV